MKVLLHIVTHYSSSKGAILVFLPGYEDINEMKDLIQSHGLLGDTSRFKVFVLHSSVMTDDQKKVFQVCSQRKIILSTNIAETSLTIDDVTFVVDPGKTKQVRSQHFTNLL